MWRPMYLTLVHLRCTYPRLYTIEMISNTHSVIACSQAMGRSNGGSNWQTGRGNSHIGFGEMNDAMSWPAYGANRDKWRQGKAPVNRACLVFISPPHLPRARLNPPVQTDARGGGPQSAPTTSQGVQVIPLNGNWNPQDGIICFLYLLGSCYCFS